MDIKARLQNAVLATAEGAGEVSEMLRGDPPRQIQSLPGLLAQQGGSGGSARCSACSAVLVNADQARFCFACGASTVKTPAPPFDFEASVACRRFLDCFDKPSQADSWSSTKADGLVASSSSNNSSLLSADLLL